MTDTQIQAVALPAVATVLGKAAEECEQVLLDGGLTALVVRDPGRTLNISARRRVYEALIPVTTSSFGADMTPYWTQRCRDGYLERLAEFVLVADGEGAMVGWTGFHLLPHDEHVIIYLDSTGMVPQRQSRGVMRELMRRRIVAVALPRCPADRPVYLTARSESPVFYRLMRGLLPTAKLYPHPADPVPVDVRECGVHLAEWLGQRAILDSATLTLRGAYHALNELYGELPTTGDPDLDRLFRGQLGPLDAFLLIGRAR